MEKWEKLVNHVIEVLDKPHGQEVKAFYVSIGYGGSLGFSMRKSDGDLHRFYGYDSNGKLNYWSEDYCNDKGYKIITLEEAKLIVEGTSITTDDSFNIPLTKIVGRVVI